MDNLFFKELELSPQIQKALVEMGFEEATPIQYNAIPQILAGRDIIGQAQTGTGKTCAFGIPAVEIIEPDISGVQVLALCPTRELAIQVAQEIKAVAKYKKQVKVLPIYGGQPIERQITALKDRPQIIIGTPGRIMDHLRRHTLKLENLKLLILDEADEMLNMGFREDIDIILEDLPKNRQTLLFSATLSKEILEIAALYLKNPKKILTVHNELTIPSIEQYYLEVRESSKLELLCRLIDAKNIKLSLVFCNTKKRVDALASALQERGYLAEALHGDLKQSERDRVMAKFRTGGINILIATDVAARGIDINNIEAVFNYDIPGDCEYYVHRIGRTARAGKKGTSYSFAFGRDIYKLKDIQRYTKSVISQMKPPSISDIEKIKLEIALKQVSELVKAGGFNKYKKAVESILNECEDATSLDIAAVLFKLAFDDLERKYEVGDLDEAYPKKRFKGNMVRLFMNIGSMDNLQPKTILQILTSKTPLSGREIGSIDIHRQFTFFDVPEEYAEDIIKSLKGFNYRGRRVAVDRAGKRKRADIDKKDFKRPRGYLNKKGLS